MPENRQTTGKAFALRTARKQRHLGPVQIAVDASRGAVVVLLRRLIWGPSLLSQSTIGNCS